MLYNIRYVLLILSIITTHHSQLLAELVLFCELGSLNVDFVRAVPFGTVLKTVTLVCLYDPSCYTR